MTQEKFISRMKAIYGDRFDYSKVEYKGVKNRVILIDKLTKKERIVKPTKILYNHKKRYVCIPKEERTIKFIEKSKKKFGDKFDYSKTRYIDSQTPVTLICKEHGEFSIDMYKHLYSKDGGCPLCNEKRETNRGGRRQLSTDYFIKRCKKIYGDKYDYSKVEYKGGNSKTEVVEIICPIHGSFLKTYDNIQSRDCGCPKCAHKISKLEEKIIDMLTKENIKFKKEYINKKIFGNMRGDFFIKSRNIMIECQGKQHFEECNSFHDSYGGGLSGQIERDYNFSKCCKDANIKLLYYFNKKNTKGVDYLNDKKFNGIYTKQNTFTNIDSLISSIKSN